MRAGVYHVTEIKNAVTSSSTFSIDEVAIKPNSSVQVDENVLLDFDKKSYSSIHFLGFTNKDDPSKSVGKCLQHWDS